MPPPSPSAFADWFRELDAATRTRFVAALWCARGWETSVADDIVVARSGERTRRIGVVRPGRFRTPSLSDLDVVVVTHDRPRVREAAAARDVEYVTTAALRDLLCYGLDREEAATIFQTHFGRPLEVPRRREAPADEGAGQGPTRRLSTRSTTQSAGAVLVVVCVVLAGVSLSTPSLLAFGGSSAPAATVTGTFTSDETGALGGEDGTTDASAYPAGLDADGVVDATALSAAHRAATRNHRYALSFDYTGPPEAPPFDGWVGIDWELVVEHRYAFQVDARYEGVDDRWRTVEVYANGVDDYRRYGTPNGTQTRVAPVGAETADAYAHFAPRLVATYLNTTASTAQCISERSGACQLYRVVATGDAPVVTAAVADSDAGGNVANYEAVALVTADGLVSVLRVRYDLVRDGFPETISLRFSYDEYGTAKVSPPAWVSELRSSGADDTPTPGNTTVTPEGATTGEPTRSTPADARTNASSALASRADASPPAGRDAP